MAAPKGNRFWEARSTHGRNPIFKAPEDLWSAAEEYFQWASDNPLQEEKLFHFQGAVIKDTVSKMRAMTQSGLCLFLDVDEQTLNNYEKKDNDEDGFFGVVRKIKSVIRDQKFSGAAADLLNANIIARDLGLSDKSNVDHSSSDGTMSPRSIEDFYEK